MTRRMLASCHGRQPRSVRPSAVGAVLALALAAGCGSSGGGSVIGAPPPPTPTLTPTPSPTDFPGPSTSVTPTPSDSTSNLREFNDSASGISLTVPDGYVVATTPAEAAARFPDVLGSGSDADAKIADAQSRLRRNTIMIAFSAPSDGVSDNVGLLKVSGQSLNNPAQIQSLAFQAQARTSLTRVGARDIQFTDTKLGGQPAEQVKYSISSTGGRVVYGQQFYVAKDTNVFILTVTGGTADRADSAASDIVSSWTFS